MLLSKTSTLLIFSMSFGLVDVWLSCLGLPIKFCPDDTIIFLIASFVRFETIVVDYFTMLGITQKFNPVNGIANHLDYDIWPLPWSV